jgi:FMN phosphatase YigB (HAD superfamily)
VCRPDVINTFKAGPAFYALLLADAEVAPADAVVVDDSRDAVAWAAEVSVRAIRVGALATSDGTTARCISSLTSLPPLLAQMEDVAERR